MKQAYNIFFYDDKKGTYLTTYSDSIQYGLSFDKEVFENFFKDVVSAIKKNNKINHNCDIIKHYTV